MSEVNDEPPEALAATAESGGPAETTVYIRVRSDHFVAAISQDELDDGMEWDPEAWEGHAFTEHAVPVVVSAPEAIEYRLELLSPPAPVPPTELAAAV